MPKDRSISHFGSHIRRARKENGFSVQQLADKMGTSKGYISAIETGKVYAPSERLILRCAKALNQDPIRLSRMAWVDRAPGLIRSDAELFLQWFEKR